MARQLPYHGLNGNMPGYPQPSQAPFGFPPHFASGNLPPSSIENGGFGAQQPGQQPGQQLGQQPGQQLGQQPGQHHSAGFNPAHHWGYPPPPTSGLQQPPVSNPYNMHQYGQQQPFGWQQLPPFQQDPEARCPTPEQIIKPQPATTSPAAFNSHSTAARPTQPSSTRGKTKRIQKRVRDMSVGRSRPESDVTVDDSSEDSEPAFSPRTKRKMMKLLRDMSRKIDRTEAKQAEWNRHLEERLGSCNKYTDTVRDIVRKFQDHIENVGKLLFEDPDKARATIKRIQEDKQIENDAVAAVEGGLMGPLLPLDAAALADPVDTYDLQALKNIQ